MRKTQNVPFVSVLAAPKSIAGRRQRKGTGSFRYDRLIIPMIRQHPSPLVPAVSLSLAVCLAPEVAGSASQQDQRRPPEPGCSASKGGQNEAPESVGYPGLG